MTTEPTRPLPSRRLFRWLVALAIPTLGTVVGVAYYANFLRASPPVVPEPTQEKPHKPEEPAELPILTSADATITPRERLDRTLYSGNFAKGLKLVANWDHGEHDAVDPELLYREAICLEGLKRWSEALERYRTAEAAVADGPSRSALRLGIARCQIAVGNRDVAEREIRGVAHDDESAKTQRECLYHLASLSLRFAEPTLLPNPFDATAIAWAELDPALGTIIDRLPVTATHRAKHEAVSHREPNAESHAESHSHTESVSRVQVYEAVRAALDSYATHPAAASARTILANAQFEAREFVQARSEWKRIRDEAPTPKLATVAAYNLGLLEFQLRRWAEAREAFLDVADRNRGSKWEALGWWWIGRIELDNGNSLEAEKAWKRAVDGPDRGVRSAVELGRVLIDLLEGNEERGSERFALARFAPDEQHRTAVAAFAAYFQQMDRPTPNRAALLAAAIAKADHGRLFGPAGAVLFGEWHAFSGHPERQLALYEESLPTARGLWAFRMTFAMAEQLMASGHTSEARQRFLALDVAAAGRWGNQARFALAKLAAAAGDGKQCVARCRGLLHAPTVDRAELLRILGRGYEQQGRSRMAADCFAGRVPTDE